MSKITFAKTTLTVKKLLLILWAIIPFLSLQAEDPDSLYAKDMLPIGAMAPEMVIDSASNVTLESLRGRYVVLHFWASWCPDCRRDMAEVNDLSYVYNSDSIVFIHVSYDTNKEAWQKYIEDNKMFGLQLSEMKKMRECATYKLFKINWIPAYYVINTEGRIIERTVDVKKLARRMTLLDRSRIHIPRSKMSKNPEYKGGETMLRYYLAKSIKYPRVASNYGLEGQTTVKFMVEADGKITNARVIDNKITVEDKLPFQKLRGDTKQRTRQEALDAFAEEALRVINEMPNWNPGKRYGMPIKVEYELPINFKMKYNTDDVWSGHS